MWPKYTSRSLYLFSISLQHYVYNVFKGGIMCGKNTILRPVFGFLAPKPAYSQGVTSYTQTQQTRQVTVIKPAAPNPASSTFSIYPVTSTVQPVAAAASVVPTYSQSPTYSTNAVTYSGELLTPPGQLFYLSIASLSFLFLHLSFPSVYPLLTCFPGTSYSGYEAAVYSAASSYYQQQQQQQQKQAVAAVAASAAWTGNTFTKKAPFQNKTLRPKQPPKPPQIHYCDVCKISCAGPQVGPFHPIILLDVLS